MGAAEFVLPKAFSKLLRNSPVSFRKPHAGRVWPTCVRLSGIHSQGTFDMAMRGYGFRAPAFGRPRNDQRGSINNPHSAVLLRVERNAA